MTGREDCILRVSGKALREMVTIKESAVAGVCLDDLSGTGER